MRIRGIKTSKTRTGKDNATNRASSNQNKQLDSYSNPAARTQKVTMHKIWEPRCTGDKEVREAKVGVKEREKIKIATDKSFRP
ncbi:hypothetical protein ANO14919_003540 [Xylariales sp. No.14919]|nr:hypothetical protein ANO14919_003540 [Xylariales sp. No.14919]